jgi:hypothetical protein
MRGTSSQIFANQGQSSRNSTIRTQEDTPADSTAERPTNVVAFVLGAGYPRVVHERPRGGPV